MSVSGLFSTMSMPDVIQWARTAQRTGLLRLSDDAGKLIQVTFNDGRIIFSSTNDKREAIGAYFVSLGLCTSADIDAAIEAQKATGAMLASVLVHGGKVTAQKAIAALTDKTIEDLCDAFLWSEGKFNFEPRPVKSGASLTISLDPIRVVVEGVRRREIWNRMSGFIHPSSFYERTDQPFDGLGEWEDLETARRVYPMLDGHTTVGDLLDRLAFARYKIHRAVSELIEHHLIRAADVTGIGDRERRVARKMLEAHEAAEAGRWTEAMEMLQGLAGANPGRRDILDELLAITDGFRNSIYEHNFTLDDVPVVTIGPTAMAGLNIQPAEGFVLSRIDGRLSVRSILKISPISEFDGLRTFKRLLAAKVIDFPHRAPSQQPAADVSRPVVK